MKGFILRHVTSLLRRKPPQVEPVIEAPAPQEELISYETRLATEQAIFADQVNVHELPKIFHYWSNKHLRPLHEVFGFSNPDQFYVTYLARAFQASERRPVRFASVGAGNSDTEVRIAVALRQLGIEQFVIECIDINPQMLDRGRALALDEGVASHVVPQQGDFNDWRPNHRYDAILANQSLHHVQNLESLFGAIRNALTDTGLFVTADMIGRNGHLRWPEAVDIVREFWRELPPSYRYNVRLNRQEDVFLDWDSSQESFEGIRAQDVLPLLVKNFEFEFFLGFANAIDPFVDRSFGHHFNADAEWDRDFIDRVHARDEAEILSGRIKPTHMLAVMRKEHAGPLMCWKHLTPEFCLRPTAGSDD